MDGEPIISRKTIRNLTDTFGYSSKHFTDNMQIHVFFFKKRKIWVEAHEGSAKGPRTMA